MKNTLFYGLSLCLLLFAAGCEKEIEFNGVQTEPRLTLSSRAEPGELLRVYVSTSVFFLEDLNDGSVFKEKLDPSQGHVRFFVNGATEGREMMLLRDLSDFSYCYQANYRPASGDRIRLEAEFPGFDPVVAETTVPYYPQFELLQTEWAPVDSLAGSFIGEGYYDVELTLAVTDDASYDKYYFVQPLVTFQYPGAQQGVTTSLSFSSSDILFRQVDGTFGQAFGGSGVFLYSGGYFSDALIKGQRHVFTIRVSRVPDPENPSVSFGLRVAAVNESLYWYDLSYSQVTGSFSGIFSEGVTLYSNVKGGYGVFCASATRWLEVD